MLCPSCKVELKIADRQGVEIDYCPQCRGVWLERGELNKIIERSLDAMAAHRAAPARPDRDREPVRGERDDDDHAGYDRRTGKRRKGWLGDLFDFD